MAAAHAELRFLLSQAWRLCSNKSGMDAAVGLFKGAIARFTKSFILGKCGNGSGMSWVAFIWLRSGILWEGAVKWVGCRWSLVMSCRWVFLFFQYPKFLTFFVYSRLLWYTDLLLTLVSYILSLAFFCTPVVNNFVLCYTSISVVSLLTFLSLWIVCKV